MNVVKYDAGPMHPAEVAWRGFRRDHGNRLALSLASRRQGLNSVGVDALPAEITLPSICTIMPRRDIGDLSVHEALAQAQYANTCSIFAAYRESKTIYLFEPAIESCLAKSHWPVETPTAALRLPSRCPVISLQNGDCLAATYDLLLDKAASGRLTLRLSRLLGARWYTFMELRLTETTVDECMKAAISYSMNFLHTHGSEALREAARDRDRDRDLKLDQFVSLARQALTLLLYLGGEPDIVKLVHPGARPTRDARIGRRNPERWKDLREPNIYAVGRAFQAAIERWEIEQDKCGGQTTGRTIRPHTRRAHSHLYWTGPSRQIPRVRFLLPIRVKGGKLIEEPEYPKEFEVR